MKHLFIGHKPLVNSAFYGFHFIIDKIIFRYSPPVCLCYCAFYWGPLSMGWPWWCVVGYIFCKTSIHQGLYPQTKFLPRNLWIRTKTLITCFWLGVLICVSTKRRRRVMQGQLTVHQPAPFKYRNQKTTTQKNRTRKELCDYDSNEWAKRPSCHFPSLRLC